MYEALLAWLRVVLFLYFLKKLFSVELGSTCNIKESQ